MKYYGSFTNNYLFRDLEYKSIDPVLICTVKSFSTLRVDDDVSGYVFRNPESVVPEEIGLDSIRKIIGLLGSDN